MGGGASGYFAAITCAENNPNCETILFEGTSKPLAKVLVSGGGRCNVTHHCFEPAELVKNYPRGFKELRSPFSRFQPKDTVAWFEKRGVPLKIEKDGRMFPTTDRSETIAQCLRQAAENSRVKVELESRIKKITYDSSLKKFSFGDSPSLFDQVVLATGGSASGYELARSLGHTLIPSVPSLFTFNIEDPRLMGLEGLSFQDATLSLLPKESEKSFLQRGPLLITHWGLSGPAVLKLSAWVARELFESHYQADLKINFLSGENLLTAIEKISKHKNENTRKNIHTDPALPVTKRFWARTCETLQIPANLNWASLTKAMLQRIAQELTEAKYLVTGKGVFKEEFVTAGGVSLKEIDFKTMQSRICPGLYFAGEIMDVDGITGGFNFQNAWSSGWIAGQSIANL